MIIGKCCKCGKSEITSYFGDGCVNYECTRNVIPNCYIKIKRISDMLPTKESVSDWKILDVSNLEPDILDRYKYEFEKEYDTENIFVPINWQAVEILKDAVKYENKYRYREIPTKKTHEELAEEYARLNFVTGYGETVINAFIAGRKSLETES